MAAIDKYFSGGSLLDVGTGTGILAIAAAKLFPEAKIIACDIDEDALLIAQDNARANDVGDQIEFVLGPANDAMSSADLVCANLTADLIAQTLSTLMNLTCGKLVLSGILETQLASMVDKLHTAGVSEVEVTQDGEWVCCVV